MNHRRTLLLLQGCSAEPSQCCLCLQVGFPAKTQPPGGLEQER